MFERCHLACLSDHDILVDEEVRNGKAYGRRTNHSVYAGEPSSKLTNADPNRQQKATKHFLCGKDNRPASK